MNTLRWGIIGCGDVTEVKSGPAFNKVDNSQLLAVMRRDEAKARDYAERHKVPKWYTDANALINDPDINAIYVATPPSTHELYTIAALKAGKPVYVEKPMSMDAVSAHRMTLASHENNVKLSVAHYRRAQPLFKKIKELIDGGAIGIPRSVKLEYSKQPLTAEEIRNPRIAWRIDPAISGGGLFHDLAPHQIDLLYHFFGEVDSASGNASNQLGVYEAPDNVTGKILFKNGVLFKGSWCFSSDPEKENDKCEIVGDKGSISFSFFNHQPILVTIDKQSQSFEFDPLPHVQQPMIQMVVSYFLGHGSNPCSGDDGVKVMELVDKFTS